MKAWKRGWTRGAWTAFLVLFATWAIAGTSLCGWHGAPERPPGDSHAMGMHAQASHDEGDPVCEEWAYLPGMQAAHSAIERPLMVDAALASHAPMHYWSPAVVATSISPPRWRHPRAIHILLDTSPRLRI